MSNIIDSITDEIDDILGEPEVEVSESGGETQTTQSAGFNSIVYNLPEMSQDEAEMNSKKGVVIGCPEILFSTGVTPLYDKDGNSLRSLDFLVSQLIVDSNIQRVLSKVIDDKDINQNRDDQIKKYIRTGYEAFQSLDLLTQIYRNVRLVNAASNLTVEDESFDGNASNLKSIFELMDLNVNYDTLSPAQAFAAAVYVLFSDLSVSQNDF